jgi:hypothetical protein
VPFLKLKEGEIMALKELHPIAKDSIIPFFDFPPKQDSKKPYDFAKKSIAQAKKLTKHFGTGKTIYLDTYDIIDQKIHGIHSYLYLLRAFNDINVIPVTGIDRTPEHKQAIIDYVATKLSPIEVICFRIPIDFFGSFNAIKDDIDDALNGLLNDLFTQIDLVMDCRLVHKMNGADVDRTIVNITNFILAFTKNYPTRKVIVTGSSIPVTLNELCKTRSHSTVDRNELKIHKGIAHNFDESHNILFGDYTTISPEFAEPNTLAAMNGASKFIYPHDNKHYIWRGMQLRHETPLKTIMRNNQYNEHIRDVMAVMPSIFRGASYSWADANFFYHKDLTSGYSQKTIIKPLVNAHISYMLQTYSHLPSAACGDNQE